jgi:hypothetical protein
MRLRRRFDFFWIITENKKGGHCQPPEMKLMCLWVYVAVRIPNDVGIFLFCAGISTVGIRAVNIVVFEILRVSVKNSLEALAVETVERMVNIL